MDCFLGLLRCGKSCRLRWINYLRPDIKRGNFTPQEEQTIINLHETLGNRFVLFSYNVKLFINQFNNFRKEDLSNQTDFIYFKSQLLFFFFHFANFVLFNDCWYFTQSKFRKCFLLQFATYFNTVGLRRFLPRDFLSFDPKL